jgi:hypothetical protein
MKENEFEYFGMQLRGIFRCQIKYEGHQSANKPFNDVTKLNPPNPFYIPSEMGP